MNRIAQYLALDILLQVDDELFDGSEFKLATARWLGGWGQGVLAVPQPGSPGCHGKQDGSRAQ
jgi:hypothetical protein